MKIRSRRDMLVQGRHVSVGEVIDVPERVAQDVINLGKAEAVNPEEAPKPRGLRADTINAKAK